MLHPFTVPSILHMQIESFLMAKPTLKQGGAMHCLCKQTIVPCLSDNRTSVDFQDLDLQWVGAIMTD